MEASSAAVSSSSDPLPRRRPSTLLPEGRGGWFGKPHDTLQKYECKFNDYDSLIASLSSSSSSAAKEEEEEEEEGTTTTETNKNSILKKWRSRQVVDPNDITTWFRNDSHIAFYDGPPTPTPTPSTTAAVSSSAFSCPTTTTTTTITRAPLTYAELHKLIKTFVPYKLPPVPPSFTASSSGPSSSTSSSSSVFVVALLLPPHFMAEMAVAILTLLAQSSPQSQPSSPTETEKGARQQRQQQQRICIAPIDPNMSPTKIITAFEQLQCTALVTTRELYNDIFVAASSKEKDETPVKVDHFNDIRFIEPSSKLKYVGSSDWKIHKQVGLLQPAAFADNDVVPALLLRTSGTTSAIPKIVPISLPMLLYNATCLAISLQLDDDIACNSMPLWHIGGISCGLLAVLISGSSVIMMPGPFDCQSFLDTLQIQQQQQQLPPQQETTATIKNTVQEEEEHQQQVELLLQPQSPPSPPPPTWYYGVPTMHKALLLTAKARARASGNNNNKSTSKNNRLRFIRSGAAHLPHNMAKELAQVFQTHVYPTYSMSECMPICSCHDAPIVPIPATSTSSTPPPPPLLAKPTPDLETSRSDDDSTEIMMMSSSKSNSEVQSSSSLWLREGIPQDTVGMPIGCSVAIVDNEGRILPYDGTNNNACVGEVVLRGPGVINGYIVIPKNESHITIIDQEEEVEAAAGDGSYQWFKTGDMGRMDRNGRLVLLGRQKELIKRGGEQIWPNEIDNVVSAVPGVATAVAFGVPNELWGEEVQLAVVLEEKKQDAGTKTAATDAAKTQHNHQKQQEAIVQACKDKLGPASVPCYIHFLESSDSLPKGSTGKFQRTKIADHLGAKPMDLGALHALEAMATTLSADQMEQESSNGSRRQLPTPSPALNGVRFLTACFVVHHHVGAMPNSAWLKIQSYSLDMSIFFILGAFQLTTSIKSEVKSNSAQFIGTKIGSMHSWFVVSQIIALGAYLLFRCGENGYSIVYENESCTANFSILFPTFLYNTLTGLGNFIQPVNVPAWFQTAFYSLIFMFPLLDAHLRTCDRMHNKIVFWVCLIIASLGMAIFFNMGGFLLGFFFLSWMPIWVSAMISAYWFVEYASLDDDGENYHSPGRGAILMEQQAGRKHLLQQPRLWGYVTDIVSIIFLLFEVAVGLSPSCRPLLVENYEMMRPGEPLPSEPYKNPYLDTGLEYVEVCDLNHDEFIEYALKEPDDLHFGRWLTPFGTAVGFFRLGSPLVLLWLFGLAYGRGLTAGIMNTCVMQYLAPYAYPLYLLHVPISRIYWVATRGHHAEFWWKVGPLESLWPIPVEWYETFLLIGICTVLSIVLDRVLIRYISPYFIRWGVAICKFVSRSCCCCCHTTSEQHGHGNNDQEELLTSTTLEQVKHMVKALTGNDEVTQTTDLRDLELDSLGATALLGTLRSSVPNARHLTMAQLSSCKNVGDLVQLIDENQHSIGKKGAERKLVGVA